MMPIDFTYTRFIMRFAAGLAFICFLLLLYYAYQTEMRDEAPTDIPFAEDLEKPQPEIAFVDEGDAENAYEQSQAASSATAEAHLTDRELQNWITMVVSEALSFQSGDLSVQARTLNQYFSPEGREAFRNYLRQSGIATALGNNYQVSMLVEQMPLLLNNGEVEGSYRWLYQLPATLTIRAPSVSAGEGDTRRLTMRVQVRRVPISEQNEIGLLVESWDVSPRRNF